jgi:MEMO1 family protein
MKAHRKPAVAGLFYPAEPDRLSSQIKSFLSASRKESDSKVKFLISPHAGYVYSGKMAGEAFSEVSGEAFDRVIILGPSHRHYFNGAAESETEFWDMPTGCAHIQFSGNPRIQRNASFHENEHCIEIQIPFLLHLFPNATITPILLSGGYQQASAIADTLFPLDNEKTLWVISSDFNHVGPNFQHYPDEFGYHSGEAMDMEAIDLITSGNIDKLIAFMNKTKATICGALPILVAMHLINKTGHSPFRFKKYDCSGNQTGDINSVGYAALYC